MYNPGIPVSVGSYAEVANSTIHLVFVDQDIQTGEKFCAMDVTLPWGTFDNSFGGAIGDIITRSITDGFYAIKILDISTSNQTATLQVLSYARSNVANIWINHNLPSMATPGGTVNYDFELTNNSAPNAQIRWLLASKIGSQGDYPRGDNELALPPVAYKGIGCWYNDWAVGGTCANGQTIIGGGGHAHISGSFAASSNINNYENVALRIFVYVSNYWGTGKHEYVETTMTGQDILISQCVGKVCIPDTICVGDNRYRAICNPADPAGPCIAGTELVPPTPDPTCNPCMGITCNNICDGLDIWSQKCVNGTCVKDALIEAHSINCPSHRIDFHIRPWSWYTPDGAVTDLITKILDIDGAITNFFADIIDYRYINTEIFRSGNDVIIRINIRQLSLASGMYAMAWPLAVLKILTLVVLVGLIIIGIGMIYEYLWYLIANPMALNPTLTNKDLTDAGNTLVKEQLDNCETVTCIDPTYSQDQKAFCIKQCHDGILTPWKDYQNKVYPDADHTPLDDATSAIQTCYDTYMATPVPRTTTDYDTYLSCLKIERETNIDKDQDNTLEKYDPDASAGEKEKPGGGLGLILLAGAGIVGLTLLSKGGAPSTVIVSPSPQPTIVKEKEPSIIERGYARVKEEAQKRL